MPASLKVHPRGTSPVEFPDLADERVESLVDVDGLSGGCFREVGASEVLCQVAAICVVDQPVDISYSGAIPLDQ